MTQNALFTFGGAERDVSEQDIVVRLRKHVNDRGGPSIENGAWQMMLDAADEIERLRGHAKPMEPVPFPKPSK